MAEQFKLGVDSIGKKIHRLANAAAMAGFLFLPHNEARAFEIKPGSTFEEGMSEIQSGTLNDDFETRTYLIVEKDDQGKLNFKWGPSIPSGSTGGLASEDVSKDILQKVVDEKGGPFTVYRIHSHYTQLNLPFAIGSNDRYFSIPPSAADISTMQSDEERNSMHGSRKFTLHEAVSDGTGVWLFDRIAGDTTTRTDLWLSVALESPNGALEKWITANVFPHDVDQTTVEKKVRDTREGPLFKDLLKDYQNAGANLRYVLWRDLVPSTFRDFESTKQ